MKVVTLAAIALLPASALAIAPAYVATRLPLPGLPATNVGGWEDVRGFNSRGDVLVLSGGLVYEDGDLWHNYGVSLIDGQTGALQIIVPIARTTLRPMISLSPSGSVLLQDSEVGTLRVWAAGASTPAGVAGHRYGGGAINSAGTIATLRVDYTQVGDTITEFNTPVLLNGNTETAIGPTRLADQSQPGEFFPNSISESGRVAGGISAGAWQYSPAYWDGGQVTILPSPEGQSAFVSGETSDGVFYGTHWTDPNHVLPCLWRDGIFTPIALPTGFDGGEILSAPTSEEILLSLVSDATGTNATFLLRGGEYVSVQALNVFDAPTLGNGVAFNASGQLLVAGTSLYTPSYYLLNPVPEPTSAIFVIPLAWMITRRRRHLA